MGERRSGEKRWRLEKLLIVRLAVVMTVGGVASLPAAYTLDPLLASRSGFWKEYRWPIGIVWVLTVSVVSWWLAALKDRETDDNLDQIATLADDVHKLEGLLERSDRALKALETVAGSIRSDLSASQRTMRRDSPLTRIERQVVEFVRANDGFSSLVLLVFVGETFKVEFPRELAEGSITLDRTIEEVARVELALRRRDIVVTSVSATVGSRLPPLLRDVQAVFCVPLYDNVVSLVGCLTLWVEDIDFVRDKVSRNIAADQCRNFADDISAVAMELGRL
jgi:hypothetical protein